jgi:hypothetical protein
VRAAENATPAGIDATIYGNIMYPDDRVLVAFMPSPADFALARDEHWYRIPVRHTPKGLHAEYYAFYFGGRFGAERWTISHFAKQLGDELLTRASLFPSQPDHPRASEWYHKIALSPLQRLATPIVSLRWRRVTFIHTTWDRLLDAREINDLFVEGGEYTDRLFAALKERGLHPERCYRVREGDHFTEMAMSLLCARGRVDIPWTKGGTDREGVSQLAEAIEDRVSTLGGETIGKTPDSNIKS